MADLFEHRLSTDAAWTYKPDPRAYQLAVDAFGLAIEEIGFVASAGWNAAGAKAHGYPTFWVNRPSQPVEELGVRPDGIGATLVDLAGFSGPGPERCMSIPPIPAVTTATSFPLKSVGGRPAGPDRGTFRQPRHG